MNERCEGGVMRPELIKPAELMKPDLFSEILLLLMGAVMFFFVIFTGVSAILRH